MKRQRKPEDIAFGRRLRTFREVMGLTRKELAEQVHISPHTLAIYENGWRGPSRGILQRFADVFGISIDALLGLEPEEDVIRELRLRRSMETVGRYLGENHEALLQLYEYRREVGSWKLPRHVRERVQQKIDEIIREYQALQDNHPSARSARPPIE